MPGTLVQELFDKGLVTKRHSTMLGEGELQQSDDCVYRQFDPAIHKAPARTEYNSTAVAAGANPIKGLAFLSFDEGDDILVAYYGTALYSSPMSTITGTFAQLQGTGALQNVGTEVLNYVHYGTSYYLLPSRDRARRIGYLSAPALSVATCTLAANKTTLTTTTVKGFSLAVVGQAVSGSGGAGVIAAGSVVTFKTSDTSIEISDTGNTAGAITTVTFTAAQIPSARTMGLDPVDSFVQAQVAVQTAQSWNAVLGNGYYWFLITEMFIPGTIDDYDNGFMESAFGTKPQFAQISDYTTQSITITYGGSTYPYINVGQNGRVYATHWQIYMSDKQTDTTITPDLSTFKRVGAPIPIPQTGSPPASTTATLADTVSTRGPYTATTDTTYAGLPLFDDPTGGFKPHDGIGTYGGMSSTANNAAISLRTFGIDTSAGTVTGITVKVYASANNDNVADGKAHGMIILRRQDGTKVSNKYAEFITTPNHWETFTFGGSFDLWGESWVIGDFTNGNFEVIVQKMGTAHTTRLVVDGVEIFIHMTGTSVNRDGIPFRTVTYRSQVGTSVTDSTNFPPPIASTGDIFQGSVVLNSITQPTTMVFSLPGVAEAFPKPYKLVFNTKRKDVITNIKTLGQILWVGMRDSSKRVNYLPTELDTDFQSGLAHEDLSTDHGCVGPKAAVLFDMPDAGPMLSYVSYKGIHLTDGITTRFMNIDLDWANTVDLANLGSCVLTVYPQENWIVLFYAPFGTSHGKNTRALAFLYSPDKVKEGGFLPAVGPFKVSARSAETAYLSGKSYLLTGHQSLAKVYVEDQGLTLPASYTVANAAGTEAAITIVPTIKTRRLYPSGVGGQAREQRIYTMASPFGAAITAVSTTVSGSNAVTSAAAFGSVTVGMRVTGTGIPLDTIVQTKTDSSNIALSSNAIADGTNVTLTFDSGTVSLAVSGQDINEATTTFSTLYQSSTVGGLMTWQPDNLKESMELTFSKPDLPIAMRLHYFAYMLSDMGQETHRS